MLSTIKQWPRRLYDWVLGWADRPGGTWALGALAFAESSFFPVPPDVLLMALSVGKPKRSLWFAAVCSIGSILGGMLGYAIGHWGWEIVSGWFFAYVPGFTEAAFHTVEAKYNEWGFWIVFTAGFTPLPYKVFTIASGTMSISFPAFLLASTISRSARFFMVAGLIRIFGPEIKAFIDKYFNLLAIVFTVLLVGGFVIIKYAL